MMQASIREDVQDLYQDIEKYVDSEYFEQGEVNIVNKRDLKRARKSFSKSSKPVLAEE